ncbi:MAG: AAA family ATPase, partial [Elusimicrobia bacterium]|nr:AAA family ATPase [Elusimicrobiota bacterium]
MDSLNLFPEPDPGKEDGLPLAFQCSPKSFEFFFGQEHILAPGKLLRRAIESDRLGSVLFFGPPGTGKSALARLIAHRTQSHFSELNAVTAGVAELRKEIEKAQWRLQSQKQKTILLVDEIHHFNKSQQDALLPDVEKGTVTLIGITTENPYFYVNAALRSRSQIFEFFHLERKDLEKILSAAVEFQEKKEKFKVRMDAEAKEHILRL